jgi:hypothetical protein
MQKSMTSQNSSNSSNSRTLARVKASQAKRFLIELANLVPDGKSVSRFQTCCGEMMPRKLSLSVGRKTTLLNVVFDGNIKVPIEIFMLQNGLRNIWRAKDPRTKAWGVFRVIDEIEMQRANPPSLISLGALSWSHSQIMALPAPSAFEQAMEYLRKHGHLAQVCAYTECPAPYFFAIRRSQKYCSAKCAEPSQRQFKCQWWAKHGKARRAMVK